jgi:hypothetical protein
MTESVLLPSDLDCEDAVQFVRSTIERYNGAAANVVLRVQTPTLTLTQLLIRDPAGVHHAVTQALGAIGFHNERTKNMGPSQEALIFVDLGRK